MTALALPLPIEASVQEMERRGAEASRKIDEAAKAVDEGSVDDLDFDDPSVVRHIAELRTEARRVTERVKAATLPPPAGGTPPSGSKTPIAGIRLVRPPRKPPRDDG